MYVWVTIGVMLFLVLSDVFYRQYASRRIQGIVENVPTFAAIPAPCSPDVRTVSIPVSAAAGDHQGESAPLLLQASVHLTNDAPRGLVIFCPELNGNHWTALHYCRALLDSGFAVLGFDFRNQGASDHQPGYTPIHWVTEFEMQDIGAVLNYVSATPELRDLPVGIFGVSRGGSAALLAASRYPQIRSVMTDSGYSTMALIRHFMYKFSRFVVPDWFFSRLPGWHIELVLRQALARSQKERHCCYVHLETEAACCDSKPQSALVSGSRDSYVTPQVTQDVAMSMQCPEDIHIVHKAKHNKSRDRAPLEYDQLLVRHFEKTLTTDSDTEDVWEHTARVA